MIENRLVGIKSREIYETPAAALLLRRTPAWRSWSASATSPTPSSSSRCSTRRWSTTASGSRRFVPPCRRSWRRSRARSRARRGSSCTAGMRRGRADGRGLAVRPRARDLRGGRRASSTARRPGSSTSGRFRPRRGLRPRPARYSRGVTGPLWAGRLAGGLDPAILDFTASLPVDRRLLPYDLRASAVHVRMLARQGLIEPAEADAIVDALAEVEVEPDAAPTRTCTRYRAAARRAGAARARRPQPQRSGAVGDAAVGEGCLRRGARRRARPGRRRCSPAPSQDGGAVLPGYTHLQRAQPVLLGHHLAAHAWMLARDAERLAACARRADVCPLGAGALAGSSLPLDPDWAAAELGFARRFENSLDAVADRDYRGRAAATPRARASCTSRGSARSWCCGRRRSSASPSSTTALATGCSMMPQKKNPDVAELARGKAGTAIGRLAGLLATLKGLPLAYNRDLQEDKRAAFDQVDDLLGALAALTRVRRAACASTGERMAAAAATAQRRHRRRRAAGARGRAVPRGARQVAERVAAGERFDRPSRGRGGRRRGSRRQALAEPARAGPRRGRRGAVTGCPSWAAVGGVASPAGGAIRDAALRLRRGRAARARPGLPERARVLPARRAGGLRLQGERHRRRAAGCWRTRGSAPTSPPRASWRPRSGPASIPR